MIKVGIVDDDPLYLETMKLFINKESDMSIVATAIDLESGVSMGTDKNIDVILMDCTLSAKAPDEGVKATQIITTINPDARIVFLTSMDDADTLTRAFISGALNYIKKSDYTMIPSVIRMTHAGGFAHISTAFHVIKEEKRQLLINRLTERELEVIELLKSNMKRKEIADRLFVSEHTIKSTLSNIFKKFDIDSTGTKASKVVVKKIHELGL